MTKRRKNRHHAAQALSDSAGAAPRLDLGSFLVKGRDGDLGAAPHGKPDWGEGAAGGRVLGFTSLSPAPGRGPELSPRCAPGIPYPVRLSPQKGPSGR